MVSSLALTASPSTETWLEHKESQVALLNLKVLRLCERGNHGIYHGMYREICHICALWISLAGKCSPTPSQNLSLAQLGHGSNIINGGHLWTHCVEKYLTIRCDFGVLKLYLDDLDAFYMEGGASSRNHCSLDSLFLFI